MRPRRWHGTAASTAAAGASAGRRTLSRSPRRREPSSPSIIIGELENWRLQNCRICKTAMLLFVSERLDGIQLRRLSGRVVPEEHADGRREDEPADYRRERHLRRPAGDRGDDLRRDDA